MLFEKAYLLKVIATLALICFLILNANANEISETSARLTHNINYDVIHSKEYNNTVFLKGDDNCIYQGRATYNLSATTIFIDIQNQSCLKIVKEVKGSVYQDTFSGIIGECKDIYSNAIGNQLCGNIIFNKKTTLQIIYKTIK